MATSDRPAAGMASFGVGLVAITAAVISFSHVRSVALRAGEAEATSWLLPISVDGAVVAAASVLLADSRAGRRPTPLTWMLLALGISASLAANVASAEPTVTARVVAAWPPIALAIGIEVLAGLARRDDVEGAVAPDCRETLPDAGARIRSRSAWNGSTSDRRGRAAAGIAGAMPALGPAAGNGDTRTSRHDALDDEAAVRMIRELDAASSSGPVSRLVIQKQVGCGGSRAARLAELARQPFEVRLVARAAAEDARAVAARGRD